MGNNKKILIGAGIVGAVGIGAYLVYKMGASSVSSQVNDVNTARNNVTAAKQALAAAKANPTADSVALAAAQQALSTANQKLANALKTAAPAATAAKAASSGASSGGGTSTASGTKPVPSTISKSGQNVPVNVVDPTGNYIEKGDPTTLYNDKGDVIGNKDPNSGMFTDPKTGLPVAAGDGTSIIPIAGTNNYIEKNDPTTLYNEGGQEIGSLDPNTGQYVDAGNKPIAASDGSPITNTDASGNYQEADGTWYTSGGDPLNYDPTNYDASYYASQQGADNSTVPVDNTYDTSYDPTQENSFNGNTVHPRRRNATGDTTTGAITTTNVISICFAVVMVAGFVYIYKHFNKK